MASSLFHPRDKCLFEWLKVFLPSTCCLLHPACPLPAVCPFLSLSDLFPQSVSLPVCSPPTVCPSSVHLCLDSLVSFSFRLASFRLTSDLSFTLFLTHSLWHSQTPSQSHTQTHSCRRWVDKCWNIGAI